MEAAAKSHLKSYNEDAPDADGAAFSSTAAATEFFALFWY